jgi:hypothetical protein
VKDELLIFVGMKVEAAGREGIVGMKMEDVLV